VVAEAAICRVPADASPRFRWVALANPAASAGGEIGWSMTTNSSDDTNGTNPRERAECANRPRPSSSELLLNAATPHSSPVSLGLTPVLAAWQHETRKRGGAQAEPRGPQSPGTADPASLTRPRERLPWGTHAGRAYSSRSWRSVADVLPIHHSFTRSLGPRTETCGSAQRTHGIWMARITSSCRCSRACERRRQPGSRPPRLRVRPSSCRSPGRETRFASRSRSGTIDPTAGSRIGIGTRS
jgi:hypothetical protein